MTNTTLWQATLNASNPSKAVLIENNLDTVKKGTASATKSIGTTKVVVMPKRYSFDDNGGGYRGL